MATPRNPVWGRRQVLPHPARTSQVRKGRRTSLLWLNKKWEERAPMLTLQPSVFLRADINRILVSLLSLLYPWRPLDLKPKHKGFCGQSWEFQGLKRHTINKYLNLQLFLAQRHFDKAFLWNVNLQHVHAEKMWAQVTSELPKPTVGVWKREGASFLSKRKTQQCPDTG